MKKYLVISILILSKKTFATPSLYILLAFFISFNHVTSLSVQKHSLKFNMNQNHNFSQNKHISLKSFYSSKEQHNFLPISSSEEKKICELARASSIAYTDNINFGDFKFYKESSIASSLKWKSFINKKNKEIILAFRGTKNFFDIHVDSLLFLFGAFNLPFVFKHPRLLGSVTNEISNAVFEIKKEKNYKIFVTGHSLGGFYAQVASALWSLEGCSFSSPSFMEGYFESLNTQVFYDKDSSFSNIVVEGDIVPVVFRNHGKYWGHICPLELSKEGILGSHSMQVICNALDSKSKMNLVKKERVDISCETLSKKFRISGQKFLSSLKPHKNN